MTNSNKLAIFRLRAEITTRFQRVPDDSCIDHFAADGRMNFKARMATFATLTGLDFYYYLSPVNWAIHNARIKSKCKADSHRYLKQSVRLAFAGRRSIQRFKGPTVVCFPLWKAVLKVYTEFCKPKAIN